ncbi:hypothetical protein J6590_055923 [Homalodisca vitripennis]|nr:hypothetical protein J6590_055923 [Homalodisca vitripennis]
MPRCTTKVCEVRSGIRVSLPLSKLGGFLECVTEKRDGTYKKSTCGTSSTRRDHDSPDKCGRDDTLSIYASDSDREEADTSHAAEATKVNRSSPEIAQKDASTKEPRTSKDEAVRPQHSEVEICVPDTNEASIQRVTVESSQGDLENMCLLLTPSFDTGDPLRPHLNHFKTKSMIDRKRVCRPTSSTRSTSASNSTSCEESPARKKRKRARSRSSSVTSSTSSTSSSSSSSSSSSIGSSTSSASSSSPERNKKKNGGVHHQQRRECLESLHKRLLERLHRLLLLDADANAKQDRILNRGESSYGPVSPAEPNNTTTGNGLKTDTTGQNISCAADVRREGAREYRQPPTTTATAYDDRQDGRRYYSESPPPPRKETDTTGQNISCAADVREPPTTTVSAYDDRQRQDRRRRYSESHPPRKETDTTGWTFSEEPVVRHEDGFQQYPELQSRTCNRVRFSQGILKNSHSSEPHEDTMKSEYALSTVC